MACVLQRFLPSFPAWDILACGTSKCWSVSGSQTRLTPNRVVSSRCIIPTTPCPAQHSVVDEYSHYEVIRLLGTLILMRCPCHSQRTNSPRTMWNPYRIGYSASGYWRSSANQSERVPDLKCNTFNGYFQRNDSLRSMVPTDDMSRYSRTFLKFDKWTTWKPYKLEASWQWFYWNYTFYFNVLYICVRTIVMLWRPLLHGKVILFMLMTILYFRRCWFFHLLHFMSSWSLCLWCTILLWSASKRLPPSYIY